MENQKFDNLLNLALDADAAELAKSPQLQAGYENDGQTWEVIAKYSGTLDNVRELGAGVQVYELLNQFAVFVMPKAEIARLGMLENIEYVELPKRIYFSILDAKAESCISSLQGSTQAEQQNVTQAEQRSDTQAEQRSDTQTDRQNVTQADRQEYGMEPGASGVFPAGTSRGAALRLSGRGVLLGIVDSGIDIFHEDFRNADGTSRVLSFWDQENDAVYDTAQLNRIIEEGNPQKTVFDRSGHGTAVAGICGGGGRGANGRYRGIAYESGFLVVKMANPAPDGFPRTTELMRGVDFCFRKALMLQQPLAVNLSFGNNYGSHAGNSLVELYLDSVSGIGRSLIVAGSGNEGSSNIHTSVSFEAGRTQTVAGSGNGGGSNIHTSVPYEAGRTQTVELAVGEYQGSFGLQLWKMYADEVRLTLITPSGRRLGIEDGGIGTYRYGEADTQILVFYGEPGPFSVYQEIYFDFIPARNYVTAGIWRLEAVPERVVFGRMDLWLPARQSLSSGTGFLKPVETTTLTVPSAAAKVLTVGAYDGKTGTAAPFSGRGYTWQQNQVKPDLVAPGVGITTTASGGGYRPVTGTSFAAPMATGAAALMMQWGIVDGNDRYLYGEKIKAYLIKGAKPLPGYPQYPNPQTGWGALCVKNSIPDQEP